MPADAFAAARDRCDVRMGPHRCGGDLARHEVHDHNWGTAAPASMVDHWYWGHAHLGAYTFVAVRVVAQARYGERVIPAMLLARGADVLAAGIGGFELSFADEVIEPRTGVRLASRLAYDIATTEGPCRVTFDRRRDVLALPRGPGSGYLRFVGDARLEHAGATVAADGLWECLSFAPR